MAWMGRRGHCDQRGQSKDPRGNLAQRGGLPPKISQNLPSSSALPGGWAEEEQFCPQACLSRVLRGRQIPEILLRSREPGPLSRFHLFQEPTLPSKSHHHYQPTSLWIPSMGWKVQIRSPSLPGWGAGLECRKERIQGELAADGIWDKHREAVGEELLAWGI